MHTWQWKKSPRGQAKRGKAKGGSPESVEGAREPEVAAPAQGSWGRFPGAGEGRHWEGEDEAGTGAGSGQQRPESTKPGRVAWGRRGRAGGQQPREAAGCLEDSLHPRKEPREKMLQDSGGPGAGNLSRRCGEVARKASRPGLGLVGRTTGSGREVANAGTE